MESLQGIDLLTVPCTRLEDKMDFYLQCKVCNLKVGEGGGGFTGWLQVPDDSLTVHVSALFISPCSFLRKPSCDTLNLDVGL